MKKKEKYYVINDIRWLVKDTFLDTLKEISASIDTEKNCEIIRKGLFKKVLKYNYKQESFYIKQYTTKHNMDIFKSFFLASKAQREWNQSHRLLKNRLLTAEPVAVGEKRRFGILKECYLISKAIPHSTPLKDLLFDLQRALTNNGLSKKNSLIKNLISYVKTIHEYGIFHGELHAENILVDSDNVTVFYLLDLGRAKFTRNIPLSWRVQELSRLIYSIVDTCTNEEIKELIDNYTNQLLESEDRIIFHKAVFKEVYNIKRRLWDSRTKKCLKDNNVFKVTTQNNYSINMRNEWDVNTLLTLIDKHALALKEGSDNIIKKSPKIGITVVPVSNGSIKSVCIKEYRYTSLLKRFFSFLRGSSARKAWFAAHGLLTLNIKTPKPIALLEEKKYLIIKKSFIIMEDISTCLPCNKYVNDRFNDPYDKTVSERKKKFVSRLALSFRQLHDSEVYHGDLKANNIMVRELQNTWDFYYLDLDWVCFNKKITHKKRMKNLSQLNASITHNITYTDRLRFYYTYAGINDLDNNNKQTIKEIIHSSIQRKHVWNPTRQTTQSYQKS